jgi:hypothetical protein
MENGGVGGSREEVVPSSRRLLVILCTSFQISGQI